MKRYGSVTALDGLSFAVRSGDVFGFLGPNGSGKTTTLRAMFGLITPDAGTVELFGQDVATGGAGARAGVAGFVETPRFYPYLSGEANLRLCAAYDGGMAGTDEIRSVLELVDLAGRAGHKTGGYSYGMRQRLGIAASLLRSPRLLVLDEPTLGLDPAGMRDMRALVERLASEDITVLLSSHLMGEVEQLCNRVAVIRQGRTVYEGSLDELKGSAAGRYRLRTRDDRLAETIAQSVPGVTDVRPAADGLHVEASLEGVEALSVALVGAGVPVRALIPEEEALEAMFFRLTEESSDGTQLESAS